MGNYRTFRRQHEGDQSADQRSRMAAGEQLQAGEGPRGGVQARRQTLIPVGLHPITVPQEPRCTCPTHGQQSPPSPISQPACKHTLDAGRICSYLDQRLVPDIVQLEAAPSGSTAVTSLAG